GCRIAAERAVGHRDVGGLGKDGATVAILVRGNYVIAAERAVVQGEGIVENIDAAGELVGRIVAEHAVGQRDVARPGKDAAGVTISIIATDRAVVQGEVCLSNTDTPTAVLSIAVGSAA